VSPIRQSGTLARHGGRVRGKNASFKTWIAHRIHVCKGEYQPFLKVRKKVRYSSPCHAALMGGFMLYHGGKPCCTITPPNLRALISDRTIDPIALTKSEINDSSKGNVISKGLVMLQVAWFIINLSARRYSSGGINL